MSKFAKSVSLVAGLTIITGILFIFNQPKPIIAKPILEHIAKAPIPATTTLFFGGDIMLSRTVGAKMIATQDYSLPFEKIADSIKQNDIAFANLESPFLDKPPYAQPGLVFKADPQAIAGLKLAGFNILSTANNHAFDDGTNGINYTINWLTQNNILPLGTGLDCHDGQIITKNNIRFGFLCYSYTAINNGGKSTNPLVCDANNLIRVAQDIASLKSRVDYLIVSTHAGIEYTRTPTKFQVDFAHSAVNAGANLVIGNHPHWIQPVEQYKGQWIFYAMGNLVFDQMWSTPTREGLTGIITFNNNQLTKIDLKPVIIDDYCCTRWADDRETKDILSMIDLTSPELFVQN